MSSVLSLYAYVIDIVVVFFFQAEDGIRDLVRSRGLGDVYKRQAGNPTRMLSKSTTNTKRKDLRSSAFHLMELIAVLKQGIPMTLNFKQALNNQRKTG